MQQPPPEMSQINDVVKFAQTGRQTQLTAEIRKISASIQGAPRDRIQQVLSIMDRLKTTHFDEKMFRRRTAHQIIQDGYVTGCTDSDLVFIALARATGLPTKYVETVDLSWLSSTETDFRGHQYAEVYDETEQKWIWVDPMGKRVDIASPVSDERIIYREGLDSWDIGITDFDSLATAFNAFRQQWQTQHNK